MVERLNNNIGEKESEVIARLREQLVLSAEREEQYRKTLEIIKADVIYSVDREIAHQAFSSPTPEPVTVNVDQLAYAIECYTGDDTFSYHDLATHILSTFNITRKP